MHILIALLTFVLSGTAINFLIKRWVRGARPVLLSGQRLVVGGLLLLLAGALGGASPLDAGDIGKLFLVGLLVYTIPHPLIFMALKTPGTTEADAAIIESAIPGSAILLFSLLNVRQMAPTAALCTLGAVAVIMLGLGVFLYNPAAPLGEATARQRKWSSGHVLLLLASISTAAGVILVDLLFPSSGAPLRLAMVRTGWATVLAGVANLIYSGLVERQPVPEPPHFTHILGLALVGTVVGWTSLFWLAKSSLLATAIGIILIPVATVLYRRLQGAHMGRYQAMGAALIIIASSMLIVLMGR